MKLVEVCANLLLIYLRPRKSSVQDGMREQDRGGRGEGEREERKSHSVRLTNPNVNIDTAKSWGELGWAEKSAWCLLDRTHKKAMVPKRLSTMTKL